VSPHIEGVANPADLALAADPHMVERLVDPAGFVVAACERAKAWLTEALEAGEIERIAELKSQAEAVRVYTAQKRLGREAELAAAEVVRRAERGIGLAIPPRPGGGADPAAGAGRRAATAGGATS
jgi:hypothetical protein